ASTFANNTALEGGATMAIGGDWIVARSSFSGNHAIKRGGAIDVGGDAEMTIANSTIADNSSANGGGIFTDVQLGIVNTIIAGNVAPVGPDFLGHVSS